MVEALRRHQEEILRVMHQEPLSAVIERALVAYDHMEHTWEKGSYHLCPWWVWKEGDDGVVRFNLLGLVAYSNGWIIPEDADRTLLTMHDGGAGARLTNEERVRLLNWGIDPRLPTSYFPQAIDAVRRGDYQLALDNYYRTRVHGLPGVGTIGRSRVYRLMDESADRPDRLISRLYRDLPLLGSVDTRGRKLV